MALDTDYNQTGLLIKFYIINNYFLDLFVGLHARDRNVINGLKKLIVNDIEYKYITNN